MDTASSPLFIDKNIFADTYGKKLKSLKVQIFKLCHYNVVSNEELLTALMHILKERSDLINSEELFYHLKQLSNKGKQTTDPWENLLMCVKHAKKVTCFLTAPSYFSNNTRLTTFILQMLNDQHEGKYELHFGNQFIAAEFYAKMIQVLQKAKQIPTSQEAWTELCKFEKLPRIYVVNSTSCVFPHILLNTLDNRSSGYMLTDDVISLPKDVIYQCEEHVYLENKPTRKEFPFSDYVQNLC